MAVWMSIDSIHLCYTIGRAFRAFGSGGKRYRHIVRTCTLVARASKFYQLPIIGLFSL
jgi:hypothetical protein